jgi:excinuclease ABC subunit A
MTKSAASPAIRLRGVRHNNLKNFDLDLPLGRLIVITGLSGSGKSSLAFDTLFAEGQRRYIETFSPYARQFFDRMDKPQVDKIEGIPPAIAIEQRNSVRTTRSTVGTLTELCDYMKLLWTHVAQLYCQQCGQPVRKEPPQVVWASVMGEGGSRAGEESSAEALITFNLPLSEKLALKESLALIAKQGYQRLLVNGEIVRLDEFVSRILHPRSPTHRLTIVQDRLRLIGSNRARFVESCEQAYHFGKGKITVHRLASAADAPSPPTLSQSRAFSAGYHCAGCDLDYREPTPALFSFNHPLGACPSCRGFGRIISIDYDLAIPDRAKTLAQGAVKPWQSGMSAECQEDLMKFCKTRGVPVDRPFAQLPKKFQDWVLEGDPDYGKDEKHQWPHAWYGVKGYFRWLESKAYKMHVRVLLSRYRAYSTCPDCQGKRFQPESLLHRLTRPDSPFETFGSSSLSLADFYALPIEAALKLIEAVAARHPFKPSDPLSVVLAEVRFRLGYLVEVGLGYLTLDRPTRSLSGGETERVSLTTCLGTRLVNTLYVLDEPSVGLHARDTARLVGIVKKLRDLGNTVVVVEHEAAVMRAADQIVDLGPGRGEAGGQVVFQGTFDELLKCERSLTGQYLSGAKRIEPSAGRPVQVGPASRLSRPTAPAAAGPEVVALNEAILPYGDRREACPTLCLTNASRHNLKNLTVEIPLRRFVCLTGVSGSGKTTLAREVLLPALEARLREQKPEARDWTSEGRDQRTEVKASDRFDAEDAATEEIRTSRLTSHSSRLTGWEHLSRVVLVDQSPIGKTPRSNPAVYIGAFDHIRELFAQSDLALQRGLGASAFSFNSAQGQCERCRGAGFEKIEMQFLSDVFIRCPDCNGRRYRAHVLEIKLPVACVGADRSRIRPRRKKSEIRNPTSESEEWSIADVLNATADDTITALGLYAGTAPGRRALEALRLLQEVGLGYLRLGQPINTLSGGESQRLKLVSYLAEHTATVDPAQRATRITLFIFDEPTTGLHFDDVRVLLKVFQRLVEAGHSLLVIEHNLEVICAADWIIDLGPEAGAAGGRIVAQGTPEDIAACAASHTGQALRCQLVSANGGAQAQWPIPNEHQRSPA